MRQITRAALLSAALGAAIAASPAEAATSVAYLDGKEVWVANTDGSNKTRLSGGEGDWTAVSQNPGGWIVGVQLEAGKIPDLSRFTVWNPQGSIAFRGPLARGGAGPSYAYPLGLNISDSGGLIVYGYSAYTYAYPVGNLTTGFYALPSATVVSPALGPLSVTTAQWVALAAGDRVVGTLDDRTIGVQEAGSPGSSNFAPWLSLGSNPAGYTYDQIDVSNDGTIVVADVSESKGEGVYEDRINVTRTAGTGGAYVDDCFLNLPVTIDAQYSTVSPAGDLVGWSDTGGVKLTPTPNLRAGGPPACELPGGITTISATGSYPSLGGFDLNAYIASKTPPAVSVPTPTPPAPPAPPALEVKVGAAPKLSSGSSSQSIKITPKATGTAKVTITIDPKSVGQKGKTPISLATGSKKVTAGKQATVKLKPSKKAKSLKKKLKGKKATITITIGSAIYKGTIKLG